MKEEKKQKEQKEQKEQIFKTTLDYGEGYCDLTEIKNKEAEDIFSKKIDPFSKHGKKMLDYEINEIKYSIKQDTQNIESMTITYKTIDKKTVVLFDTGNLPADENKIKRATFKDEEKIENIYFYVSEKGYLIGFSLTTNIRPEGVLIGNNKGICFKDKNLNEKTNIIISFGGSFSKKYGLSSLFCHYISENDFLKLKYIGLLELNAKLKDKEFAKKIDINNLDEKMKLFYDVCILPDVQFSEIYSYLALK